MIIKDLLTNLTLLVSILFLYSQITENRPLNRTSSFRRKIVVGILGGLLGFILMQYSIQFGTTLIDLRHIPIILLAVYGGRVPALTAMLLILAGRFLLGVNISAYASSIMLGFITVGIVLLSNTRLSKNKKIFFSLTWNNIIFTIIISYVIHNVEVLTKLIPVYWVISYLGGYAAFYVIDKLRETQLLFNKYKNESSIDGLTGLNNYRKFDYIFNQLISTIDKKDEKFALLYIDIDFFKKINDNYGHTQGDMVLKQLGEILKNNTRSFDIVSRNGGEEFTVLLLDCPIDNAAIAAENMRKVVEEHPFQLKKEIINLTISIGVSCYKDTTTDANYIVEDADKALYEAKNSGRNRVCVAGY
ncbi:diguanylate cyclase [Virgibacillus flavescens]|uniref:diguanylate cyclase n=1 Tax=Virgibacillus flavescens TaxID=1611422 RepID=UPI003D33662B